MSIRTVKVSNVSLGATQQDIKEFFSFCGVIEYVDMKSDTERSQAVFVTFKDPQGAETAVLLSGATIVDLSITIALEPDYILPSASSASTAASGENNLNGAPSAAKKAGDVVSSMLAKGFVLGKDVINRAKAFDERHQVTSTAAGKVASMNQKIGLSEKISTGATILNDKVKEMDQKFQVSEKTRSAYATAGQTVGSAGSAIMKNRYVLSGTSWVTGAFDRATKAAAGDVGQKTMEKVDAVGEQGRNVPQVHSSVSPEAVNVPLVNTTEAAKAQTPVAANVPKVHTPEAANVRQANTQEAVNENKLPSPKA